MACVSKIDMGEVTRLTRAGRLEEAMAVLRGEDRAAPPPSRDVAGDGAGPTLDLEATVVGASRPRTADAGPVDGAAPIRRSFAPGAILTARGPNLAGFEWPRARGAASAAASDDARFREQVHAGAAGTLAYKLYVPRAYEIVDGPVPLLVMLHGCTQSPDDFAAGTRMNELAEEGGFLVVYPAQSQRANAQRCWNWFSPADRRRDGGEAALIAGIVHDVIAAHRVDRASIYAAGLSAGGASAAILGQCYPDLFAAVGIHSGLACGAADDVSSAFAAMQGRAPARHVEGGRPISTIVFHGDGDRTVAPVNGERVLAQAGAAGQPDAHAVETGRSPGGVAYTRTASRLDHTGRQILLERWVLHGAGHAWAGGSPAGSFTDPDGPDASREMLRFFAEVSRRE